jgi:hypothetical protein
MSEKPLKIAFNFDSKLKELETTLADFKGEYKKIAKAAFREVMMAMRKEVQQKMRANKKTGKSMRALNYYAFADGGMLFTTRYVTRFHEQETNKYITAKKDKYLTFKINGQWKKVKSVYVSANGNRKYMTDTFMSFISSGSKMSEVFDRGIQKGLERMFKKLAEVK